MQATELRLPLRLSLAMPCMASNASPITGFPLAGANAYPASQPELTFVHSESQVQKEQYINVKKSKIVFLLTIT
jgi:hypothetical protein